jgi:hypothetical protein
MGKISAKKIEQLVSKGRLLPLIEQRENNKHYIVGYTRKSTSRKNDRFMLPEPQEIHVPAEDVKY